MKLLSRLTHIMKGQTLLRILMNEALQKYTLSGRVIDVGGGRAPDYVARMHKEAGTTIEPVDGSISGINFEKDALPYEEKTIDCVITCNLLEHIYHFDFLLRETHRVLKPRGRLVGFVPFMMAYHPDPHDYFRYTKEALKKMLAEVGYDGIEVKEVGGGPFFVTFNTLMVSVPRIFRGALYPLCALLDGVFLFLRPRARDRYPLGYCFCAVK